MSQKLLCVLILFCGSGVITKDIKSFFQICTRDNANECLKGAIQDALIKLPNGLSDYKIPTIDPLKVPTVTIGAGTGPVQVVQNYKDVQIINISKTKIQEVKSTLTDKEVMIEVHGYIEDLVFHANYDLNGKILVLPIVGNGKCTYHLSKLKYVLTINGEPEEKNGKLYMPIKEVKMELDPEQVTFNFENLFNGDEKLGAQMNKVLNDNSKDVFADIKSGYEEFLAIVIKGIANLIFATVPYDELFPKN